jgi:hypothetical protein
LTISIERIDKYKIEIESRKKFIDKERQKLFHIERLAFQYQKGVGNNYDFQKSD